MSLWITSRGVQILPPAPSPNLWTTSVPQNKIQPAVDALLS